jgi:hypothetical protein
MMTISSLESLVSARNARRREYKRSALAELSRNAGTDTAEVALSLGMAEIWEDCYDRAAEITG